MNHGNSRPLRWPSVGTAKPVNLADIEHAARPVGAPVAPHLITFDVHHPRKCLRPERVPPEVGPVYWCVSCDRRVENPNQPFCPTHKAVRDRHMRRKRDAYKRPVKVPRSVIDELHQLRASLTEAKFHLTHADTAQARGEAWREMQNRLDELALFLHLKLPKSDSLRRRMPADTK